MTKEELLKPRYKVIADWPGCQWPVGTIFPDNFADFKKWPHLFEDMPWWAERKPEEMPEYLKYQFMPDSPVKIKKVGHHFRNSTGDPNRFGFMADKEFHSYSKSLPATESEYKEYINQKTPETK